MRAVGIKAFGGADALEMMEVPTPEPGPGEALVKVAYAGINFLDVYMRSGLYKGPTPTVLGMEGSGEIVKLGPGTADLKPGDKVCWCMTKGAYAEYQVVAAWKLSVVPADVPMDVAAALPLQGSTAHYLLNSTYALKAGEVALVHAAAGGVGQLLVQLAKAKGATVIATVGSAEKAAVAKARGADHTVLYRSEDFQKRVMELTGGAGAHVAYDSVGKDTLWRSLTSLRRRGVCAWYGQSSGMPGELKMAEFGVLPSVYLIRPRLNDYMLDAAEVRSRMSELFALVRSGKLDLAVDRVWPFGEAAAAHAALEGRGTMGKLLLKVTP